MAITKYIKRQDCGLKLSSGNSGETSINLSNEILDYLSESNINKGEERLITFRIVRDDFVKAICFIVSKLPLYKSSSRSSVAVDYSYSFFVELQNEVNNYFGNNEEFDYTCTLYYREDGRIYLKGLKQNNFSIRDFLVENNSAIEFEKLNGLIYARIKSNISDVLNEKQSIEFEQKLLISESGIRHFAFKCISYFSEIPSLWNNVSKYLPKGYVIKDGDSIKLSKDKDFSLVGMFKCTTEENLINYNTPRRRWFSEPFSILNNTVFLSTEWYPDTRDDGSPYSLMITDLAKFINICFGQEFVCKKNGDEWELWYINDEDKDDAESLNDLNQFSFKGEEFSISTIIQHIKDTGLLYTDNLIKRFAFSLMAKRFLILSGLAGSGKTQLALAFANALISDKKQLCVVSVGADWTNREPLLGFPNALKDDEYVCPESGVLDLLIEANKEENKEKPYFLILDEMNMSYVERYFADFLSVMESGEGISLWKGSENHPVPPTISLPKNLFIIGTINVDETTYMFSPKVLDRANVIEFKILSDEMEKFLKEMKNVDRCSINGKAAGMGADFVNLANVKELDKDDEAVNTLQNFFKELKKVNAEFGYRTATEIFRYIAQAKKNDDTKDKLPSYDILDAAIIQKLLPKLHGSRKKLEPVLAQLWKLCFTEEVHIARENVDKAIYKESADKILRMYEAANANGFTSFAEA